MLGILGHEALINGKWYKVGDSVGEAKIVAIEPTKVRIAWNGQEKEFSPIGSSGRSGGAARTRSSRWKTRGPGTAQVVVTGARAGQPGPARRSCPRRRGTDGGSNGRT